MPRDSFQSLLQLAQTTFKEMKDNPQIRTLTREIKESYRDNGKKWTRESLDKQQLLEKLLEKNAYRRYSNEKPAGVSSLNVDEQLEFVGYIKALSMRSDTVDIRVQGVEDTALSSQTDGVLGNADAFRVIPKDFAHRYGARAKVGARLTINVDKAHFNQLAHALTQLFTDDNRSWLEQAKIMGPKSLGNRTDQAVIYLSSAGIEYAQAIGRKLGELLPATAFVEHIPTGMYRVGKGIAYSETVEGESSSHGQSRAKLIAAAGVQSLLTDTPIEKTLPRTLQTRGYDVQDPALLAQAVRDRELRGGLVPMSGGSEPREGSADIQQFAADPVQFAKSHVISAEALVKSGRLPSEGRAQLVAVTPGLYEVEYTDQESNATSPGHADSVPAYFLGYNGANQASASPAYVDIPKHAVPGSFLFTGTLSGCSLVVTSLDATIYRVYHDGRVNSSLLYDNVVMAVDFKDYQVPGSAEGLAAAYMQYLNGEWQLVFQRQEYQRQGRTLWPALRGGVEPLSIQIAGSQVVERKQAEFAAYRDQIHQQLKKVAALFAVSVEGISDGVYAEGGFSPDHPAIAAWTRLRNEVHARINADTGQLLDKRLNLYDARRSSTETTLIDQQIKQINLSLDYYKAQYDPVLRETISVEKTWLWQQIKAKDGTAAVVRIDDTSIQGGWDERNSSLVERYAIAESYQRGAWGMAFTEGLRNFREVSIPGVDDDMSALEMKHLLVERQLTPEQRGALSGRITETSEAEYIDKVLKQSAVFSEDLQLAGSTFDRLVPQDFYLSRVGDKSGGRCYPLVRAMAVALANGGEEGVDRLVEKLFVAAADPQAGSSTLLKNSLIMLHSNVDAVQASTERGNVKLSEVVSRLASATQTSMFALNTQGHSMMVGSTTGAEGRRYYFYDPNVGIFAFEDTHSLAEAMEQHLIGRKLAAHYGSFGSELAPVFNLIEIDTSKMALVPVGSGLTVGDLSRTGELVSVIEQRRQVEQTVSAQVRLAEDTQLRTARAIFDAEQWGARFDDASTRLGQEAGLDSRWVPVIANTEEQHGGRYRIQFINHDQPDETRWVNSDDATFSEFRRFVDEHVSAVGQHFTLERGRLRPLGGAGAASPVDGLNSGFAVQALIQWFAEKNRRDATRGVASPDLAMALKIHSYLNLVQIGHGGLQDVAKVTDLVRTALRGEMVAAETSLKDFVSTLGNTINEGAGVLFGGGMVGLDAYELAYAENDAQKAMFGTQLAFDSASFVTGAAGVGAGLLGASTAGALLGGTGVILGGLAVGFTGLAQAFAVVAEDVKAVGRYFDTVDNAYKGNGYRYDDQQQVLVPLAGAVIKTVDLREGWVDFDSQYIYRTRSGSTGSGQINYFFWGGDFPVMIHDRSQAIEVRSGIGYGRSRQPLAHGDSKLVILPGTPKSYISYGYIHFPGATTRHDAGFDVIRKLEQDKRFDYDFYIFPSEYIVSRIHQEYVPTPIEVVLDLRSRQLVVPELPTELHGYLHYEFKGEGGEYVIGLNEGVSTKLAGSAPSSWIIDSSQLASDTIEVSKTRLVIGGVGVDFASTQVARVWVITHKSEIHKIDFGSLTTRVVGEDASKWQVPGQQIEQHLHELALAHQLQGQYVGIENYYHDGRNVGRGYYDVANNRMLFTDTAHEQAKHAQLGAVIGDYAYFYDAENAAAWRVTIATGRVNVQFNPWFNQSEGRISRLWQEGDAVCLARHHLLKGGSEAELSYRILDDRMELVSAVGDDALLQLLACTGQHGDSVKAMLKGYESDGESRKTPGYVLEAAQLEPTSAALVTVFGNDAAGVAHRYWIRSSDCTVIKPNLAPPADQTLHFQARGQIRSAWPIPADLVLAGSMSRLDGMEVFFFYSQTEKVLFRQEGAGQAVLDATQPNALRVSTPALANVLNLNGNLVAMTDDGRVARIGVTGQLSYEAVNEHWLKGRSAWWKDLASVAGSRATLAVFGVRGTDGKSALPVWYHNGQMVVASASLQGKPLQFLGFEVDDVTARLYDPDSGKLYRQPPMSPAALAAAFSSDGVLEASAQIPAASQLAPELHLKAAEQVDTGMRLSTVNGEILLRANNGELQLVAVDKEWQQDNFARLSEALTEVVRQWQAKGVLTLQGGEAQGWFDIASGQVFSGQGIPAADNLRFVGIAPGESAAYVYSPTTEELYLVKESGVQMLSSFTAVERIGSSLLLQGGDSRDDLSAPIIAGVDSVLLHGGANGDIYRFNKAIWMHYRTIVIDNDDPGQVLDRLIIPVVKSEKIFVSRHDNNLMLTDSDNGMVLVLSKVFGHQAAAHRHLFIALEGTSSVISVDQLAKGFTAVGASKGRLFELSALA